MRQYHVQLEAGEVGRYVLLPVDPARSELIARHFDNPRHVRSNREFTTWTGTLDGEPVSVCSTGIGGPSTAIAFEELCNVGADTLIRVGTCGSVRPGVRRGDLVVMNAAVRCEGTSSQYAPLAFPAVADLDVTVALRDAAAASGQPHHVGVTVSMDSFYSEMEPERMPLESELRSAWQAWQRAGVMAAEMECGTLYVAAAVRGVRSGAICVAVDEAGANDMPDHGELDLEPLLRTTIDGVRRLIALDRRSAPAVSAAAEGVLV